MTAPVDHAPPLETLHAAFVQILPRIERHGRCY